MTNKSAVSTIFILFLSISLYASSSLFLEQETNFALISRDEYVGKLGATNLVFPYRPNNPSADDSLLVKLRSIEPDTANPWFDFLYGIALAKSSPHSASFYCNLALSAAGSDMGQVFVLSQEFGRCLQPQWEQKSLEQLKKLFLASGGNKSSLISKTMLLKAIAEDNKGQAASATSYYSWVKTFDKTAVDGSARMLVKEFPLHANQCIQECNNLFAAISKSWCLQLSVVLNIFIWLRQCLIFLVFGLFIVLTIRYLPLAIHWLSDHFPATIPDALKRYFAYILLFSLLSFGALPFLWILSCLLWKHCDAGHKKVLVLCCIALALFPLSVRMEDMLRQSQSPQGTLSLYSKVIDEGYSADLDSAVIDNALTHGNDYLAQTAAAIAAIKKNNMNASLSFMQKAVALCPEDPVVLLAEGNLFFLVGSFSKANATYENCMKLFPLYAPAFFNCGEYYLGTVETIKGMACIDRATKLDPEPTNTFIKTNDDCFNKKWPRLRQLMAPEYSPLYFWVHVFPHYWGTWETANALWGSLFLGLPLLAYFFLSLCIVLCLLVVDFFIWSGNKIKNTTSCKLCEAPMCRQCKRGMVCGSCYASLQQIRNENIRQHIIEKIIIKRKRIKRCISYILDALFPGCGIVYYSKEKQIPGILLMGISSALYALVVVLNYFSFSFPIWIPQNFCMFFWASLPVYNALFVVRAVILTMKEFKVKGEKHGA